MCNPLFYILACWGRPWRTRYLTGSGHSSRPFLGLGIPTAAPNDARKGRHPHTVSWFTAVPSGREFGCVFVFSLFSLCRHRLGFSRPHHGRSTLQSTGRCCARCRSLVPVRSLLFVYARYICPAGLCLPSTIVQWAGWLCTELARVVQAIHIRTVPGGPPRLRYRDSTHQLINASCTAQSAHTIFHTPHTHQLTDFCFPNTVWYGHPIRPPCARIGCSGRWSCLLVRQYTVPLGPCFGSSDKPYPNDDSFLGIASSSPSLVFFSLSTPLLVVPLACPSNRKGCPRTDMQPGRLKLPAAPRELLALSTHPPTDGHRL